MRKHSFLFITKCRFVKIFIILFLVFDFISLVSLATDKSINSLTGFVAGFNKTNLTDTGKIVISGTIKDAHGNRLQKAIIIFDSTEVAITGSDGKFSFQPEIAPALHKIYFSCDSFVTVVRTYYPAMLSADFDIILRPQFDNGTQANNLPFHVVNKDSVVIKNSIATTTNEKPVTKENIETQPGTETNIELDFPSILFKENITGLSAQDKSFLDVIADRLKSNPTIKVDVKAYTPVHDLIPIVAQKRLNNIIKYLVENGIAANRLTKVTIPGGGDITTIDIVKSSVQ